MWLLLVLLQREFSLFMMFHLKATLLIILQGLLNLKSLIITQYLILIILEGTRIFFYQSTSLPPSQPDFPKASKPPIKQPSEMILSSNFVLLLLRSNFEICFKPFRFTTWGMLQKAFQKILLPSFARLIDVNTLINHIHVDSLNIMFYLHELTPLELRNQSNMLMIIIYINNVNINRTLIDTDSTLNVCRKIYCPKLNLIQVLLIQLLYSFMTLITLVSKLWEL